MNNMIQKTICYTNCKEAEKYVEESHQVLDFFF